MAGTDARLRLWSLSTFRATTFLIAIVLVLHLRGTLQSSLRELDTAIGFASFLLFWASTYAASRLGLRYAENATGEGPAERLLAATIVAGAWNGAFVFLLLVSAAFVVSVVATGSIGPIVAFGFAAIVGSTVAFAFGGVAGLAYGAIEGVLSAVSSRLVGRSEPLG